MQFEVQGKYNTAKIFANTVENTAMSQIQKLLSQSCCKDKTIRIMPDVHAGKGCVIGLTMEYKDIIIPTMVGSDIGCGMYVINLGQVKIDTNLLEKLDQTIRTYIPAGFKRRNEVLNDARPFENKLMQLKVADQIDTSKVLASLGTLGGGNHFIEMNKSQNGDTIIVIHTGSRSLGRYIADIYTEKAEIYCKENNIKVESGLEYLSAKDMQNYLNDMNIALEYAKLNRELIFSQIYNHMDEFAEIKESFHTIHNYIDTETQMIRKSAISAQKGEKVIIPINMKDGSIIATGKGNKDYNYSAPHGAGRLMSRSQAKDNLNLDDFKKDMSDVFSTCIGQDLISESPRAYKGLDEIVENIEDTVEIIEVIKPVYNFKA